MRFFRLYLFGLLMATSSAYADQFCFALAETYYEQVYCQLQAKAQTKNLPSFNQFKKNNEQVQASLLKRPAERNGIKLPLSLKKPPVVLETKLAVVDTSVIQKANPATAKKSSAQISRAEPIAAISPAVPKVENIFGCELISKQLKCSNGVFTLIGNKSNQRLAKSALVAENKMDLPAYKDGATNQYLTRAYQQYIVKMCEIGLCGVTMTYGKFTYLYQDINSKGLDFSQRFETMYGFLKKDKASMGVSESTATPQGLVASDCSPLGDSYYVCEKQGRNFIFARQ
ncbi:MAG: hypothetical protein B0W54_05830 [Cellvibrio sp. 79]|nr:MAG: hypothetical protein B0W54_05830 [Cellvibrio sp. 79]